MMCVHKCGNVCVCCVYAGYQSIDSQRQLFSVAIPGGLLRTADNHPVN